MKGYRNLKHEAKKINKNDPSKANNPDTTLRGLYLKRLGTMRLPLRKVMASILKIGWECIH